MGKLEDISMPKHFSVVLYSIQRDLKYRSLQF